MTLINPNTVDYLSLEKGSESVVLNLIDDLDWTDELKHLSLLQKKINRYFDFIESNEVYEQAKNLFHQDIDFRKKIKINILAKYEPSKECNDFLAHVIEIGNSINVIVDFKVLPRFEN